MKKEGLDKKGIGARQSLLLGVSAFVGGSRLSSTL